MFVDVRAMGFRLTEAIGAHVESRVTSAVRALARGVLGVTARLEDVNADRGGVDKRCTLVATVRGRRTVAVEAVDRDLYVAVDKATHRMRRMAQRLLRRRVGRERREGVEGR
jgi:ribosome-associated translation inhibitor RaiA